MKSKIFTKIGTGALALAMLFTLAACGSSDEEEEETESVTSITAIDEEEPVEEEDTSSLIEMWQSEPDENGTYFDAVVTDNEQITLYRVTDETLNDTEDVEGETADADIEETVTDETDVEEVGSGADEAVHISADAEVFWVGSYVKSDSDSSMTGFTSRRDEEAEMTCEADTLRFTYYADEEEMYFSYEDETGNEVGITLSYVTDNVVFDEAEPVAEDDTDIDVETDADNNNEETSADDNAAASEDDSNSSEGNNNADNNEADVQASSSADNATVSRDTSNDTDTAVNSNTSDSSASNDTGSTSKGSTISTSSNTKSAGTGANTNNSTSSCAHAYGSGVVTAKATCTTAGMRTYTCSKCGAVRTETIPATGHNYESKITKQATCGANGVRTYTCTICGDSYTTTINATGNHIWENVYKTVHHDATGHYETQKTGMYKCNYSGCDELFTTVTEVVNHINSAHDGHASYSGVNVDSQVWVQDSAAYDEQVLDYQRCTVCGATK